MTDQHSNLHAWTPANTSVHVHTRREGVLSPVGHDLRLAVHRFELTWDRTDGTVTGRFELASVDVETALDGDRPDPKALSRRDKARIEDKTRSDVLDVRRHPVASLTGTGTPPAGGTPGAFDGTLELRGQTRTIRASLRIVGDEIEARTTLYTPDFGIRPVSALFGTLKVRPDVEVIVRGPAP